ncbi:MAG TPA: hypothetical protein VKE98_06195 [Gemmataceae bacterium]|nr:hypothetical protein [Gemmataceae bacterium]
MIYLLRYTMILLSILAVLGTVAYFQPDLLSRFGVPDAPRQLQNYLREKNRSTHLKEHHRALDERRAKIGRIVQALCQEEIGLSEAARRVKALEKENLPPLIWAEIPPEKWPERLHVCLLELVADELSENPEKAARLLPRLEKEVQDKFGVSIRIELPEPEKSNLEKARAGPPVPLPAKKS